MNHNEIKAATDAFLDELIDSCYSFTSQVDKQDYYAVTAGGIHLGSYSKEGAERMVAKLRTKVGKVYRKHIKQLMEAAAEIDPAASE